MIFFQGNILELENRAVECLETFGLLALSLMTMLIINPIMPRYKNVATLMQVSTLGLGVFYRFLDLNLYK